MSYLKMSYYPQEVIVTTPQATKAKWPSLLETHGMKGTFATLSHRWGDTIAVRTTRKKLVQHKEFIPLDEKSQTFIDATSLCVKIGIKFIWIDSLFIIQYEPDDPLWTDEDFLKEAKRMGEIYG